MCRSNTHQTRSWSLPMSRSCVCPASSSSSMAAQGSCCLGATVGAPPMPSGAAMRMGSPAVRCSTSDRSPEVWPQAHPLSFWLPGWATACGAGDTPGRHFLSSTHSRKIGYIAYIKIVLTLLVFVPRTTQKYSVDKNTILKSELRLRDKISQKSWSFACKRAQKKKHLSSPKHEKTR